MLPFRIKLLIWRASLSMYLWKKTGIEWFWVRSNVLTARATDRNLRLRSAPVLWETSKEDMRWKRDPRAMENLRKRLMPHGTWPNIPS